MLPKTATCEKIPKMSGLAALLQGNGTGLAQLRRTR
jgi:hypothetical protein